MARTASVARERVENAARHPLTGMPYRALVYAKDSPHGVPLYFIAGSGTPPVKAEKALRTAYQLHGGACFYCRQAPADFTIDHVEAEACEGSDHIHNLVIACRPCNSQKRDTPIEAFRPEAGREWLQALLLQVQDRLNRL